MSRATSNTGQSPIKPWYREPWPWIIIGSIGTVVLACFVTLGIAIWSYDGLVTDDYYKKGLAINKTLAREQRAEALGLAAVITLLPDGAVRVQLTSRDAAFVPSAALQLRLAHSRFPDQDRVISLTRVSDNVYSGQVVPPQDGRWQAVLETEDWVLPKREVQAPISEIRLDAREPSGSATAVRP